MSIGGVQVTYPVGTPVGDIHSGDFDRSIKCEFRCPRHPEQGAWRSKDPFVSHWFPADATAQAFAAQPVAAGESLWCNCPTGSFVLAEAYR